MIISSGFYILKPFYYFDNYLLVYIEKMKLEFSIIVATYNRANLLKKALNSVIAQTYKSWEVIILDDGSTDSTELVVQPFLSENISYYKQPNKGEPTAKNNAIKFAKGKVITFLDSDDEFKPDHLASRAAILEQNHNIDLLHGGVSIVGDQYVPDRENTHQKIHISKCIVGATFFFKKEKFIALGGFKNLPIGADADLFERAKKASYLIKKTNYPSYIYNRLAGDSITHSFNI